jgi:hypothetical protein
VKARSVTLLVVKPRSDRIGDGEHVLVGKMQTENGVLEDAVFFRPGHKSRSPAKPALPRTPAPHPEKGPKRQQWLVSGCGGRHGAFQISWSAFGSEISDC